MSSLFSIPESPPSSHFAGVLSIYRKGPDQNKPMVRSVAEDICFSAQGSKNRGLRILRKFPRSGTLLREACIPLTSAALHVGESPHSGGPSIARLVRAVRGPLLTISLGIAKDPIVRSTAEDIRFSAHGEAVGYAKKVSSRGGASLRDHAVHRHIPVPRLQCPRCHEQDQRR